MGWFNQVTNAVAGGRRQFAQMSSRKVAEGSMAVAAVVATSDNELELVEQQAVANYIQENPAFSAFDPDQLAQMFETYAQKCLTGGVFGRMTPMAALKKLSKQEAREAIQAGVAIASADEFEPEEKQAIRDICNAVGLSPSEFGV